MVGNVGTESRLFVNKKSERTFGSAQYKLFSIELFDNKICSKLSNLVNLFGRKFLKQSSHF